MNLRDKYTLGDVVGEGEVKTYAARELGSEASVLVHCVTTAKVDLMTLIVRRMRSTPLGGASGIVDMVESEGEVYLITEAIPGFSSLRAWLKSEAPGETTPAADSKPLEAERAQAEPATKAAPTTATADKDARATSARPSSDLPGASASPKIDLDAPTSAFTAPVLPSTPPQPARQSIPAIPTIPAIPATPQQVSSEPGEFTRLFDPSELARAQSTAQPPSSSPAPRPPAAPSVAPPPRVSDLGAPGAPRPDLRPPVAPPAEDQRSDTAPGEFTQLFRPSRGDAFVGGESSAPHFPVTGFDESSRQPGEFTQLFQPSFGDSAVPPEEPLPSGIEGVAERDEPGVLTRILRPNRDPDSPAPLGGSNLPVEPVGAPRSTTEPGFDTMFGPVPRQDQPARAREPSGTEIFSAPIPPPPEPTIPSSQPVANSPIPPERPAPPAYASSPAGPGPPPAPRPSVPVPVPQAPAMPAPPAARPPAGSIPKPPPVLQRPSIPAAPKVPATPQPPLAQPPLPKAPPVKLPPAPKPPALPSSATGGKRGPSTVAMVLILGGLVLVLVAVVLLLK